MVNNIKNNTISEISAKEVLNALNEIKKAEIIIHEKRTPGQKELLNLFDDLLDTILTDKTLKSKTQKDNENENDKTLMSSNEDDENGKTLMSSNEDDENENENEDDDETMSQNEKREIIQGKNDILDKIIDKSKSFEEQMINLKNKSLKKLEDLKGF